MPEYNICVEYDGKQHFEANDYFGGEDGFLYRQINDEIKNEYCKNNNIRLIRIKYDENIIDKLTSFIYYLRGPYTVGVDAGEDVGAE